MTNMQDGIARILREASRGSHSSTLLAYHLSRRGVGVFEEACISLSRSVGVDFIVLQGLDSYYTS